MRTAKIKISTGKSRQATIWREHTMTWYDFAELVRQNERHTDETAAEYAAMDKQQRAEAKDTGGFVAAVLEGGKRKRDAVKARTAITLDADSVAGLTFDELCNRATDGLGRVPYIAYTTHSHTDTATRARFIFQTSREMTAEEYEPVARRVAERIGIEFFDPTTYDPERLFYWPSAPQDGPLEVQSPFLDEEPLNVDDILATYTDWRNVEEWPRGAEEAPARRTADKAEDPTTKRGVIGAFCRAYDIHEAISTFLADIYEPTDEEGRYTYKKGSTAGGLLTYEDKFAYSHHSTDPASGQNLNAFDLVRIHKFGDTKKSQKKMEDFAMADSRTRRQMREDKREELADDFNAVDTEDGQNQHDSDWMGQLELTKRGEILATDTNFATILENDPKLKGRFWLDTFRGAYYGANLPWERNPVTGNQWTDGDDCGLRVYISEHYKCRNKSALLDAFVNVANKNRRHPVREYLDGLKWDGKPRVDTLFVDYLGAEDTPLNRAMTRKALAAAVARIYAAGTKFDYCVTLAGGEGIGKSTIIRLLASDAWFCDSVTTTEGRDGMAILRGAWLVELAELASLKKSEVEQVKQYLSKTEDTYRAAYDRNTISHPRQCVFFGTTNETEFLRGDTGNRRFWIIPVDGSRRKFTGDLFKAIPAERDQIWAEAVNIWKNGEPLYLGQELEAEARQRQKDYNGDNNEELAGVLGEYLERLLPADWYTWDLKRRQAFIQNPDPLAGESMRRDKFTPAEFAVEQMGYKLADKDAKPILKQINKIMRQRTDWEERTIRLQFYGEVVRGFVRKASQKKP